MSRDKLIATPSKTIEIMQKYRIKMKKSLGQNFLVEPKILEKMIDAGQVDKETVVIEIGPGIGGLTEVLAQRAKAVYAFEIDQSFVKILADTLSDYNNVTVMEKDILQVDFSDENYQPLFDAEKLVVVANLPYYITTPIIMHLIESDLPFDRLVMMMQKEVSERLTAKAGTKAYSSLTIALELSMVAKTAFIVPKTVFIPKPNVDSAVLVLERRSELLVPVSDPMHFQAFVQQGFKQRRKTLWNNLRHSNMPLLDKIDQNDLQTALDKVDIEGSRRAETLTTNEFFALYEEIMRLE